MKRFGFALVFSLLFSAFAFADVANNAQVTETRVDWAKFYPYVPEKNEYQFELGGMQENQSSGLYWLGLTYGRELGPCLGFSVGCAQYVDFNLSFANNYQATDEMGLVSLRWQFENGSSRFSPFARLFGGVIDEHDLIRGGAVGTGGIGIGIAATIHPRFDVTFEARAGEADRLWSVALVSFSARLDRVVASTVEVTGHLIQSTIDAPKTFVDWFNDKDPDAGLKKEK